MPLTKRKAAEEEPDAGMLLRAGRVVAAAAVAKRSPSGRQAKHKPTPEDVGLAKALLGSPLAHSVASSSGASAGALDAATLARACEHLSQADPLLAPLIKLHGPPERLLAKAVTGGQSFASLSKAIIFQQLATRAAAVIYARVLEACQCTDLLTPEAILAAPMATLRGCGLSERKASYLQDLSAHFADGRLSDERIAGSSDLQLYESLIAVKGIGPWTIDMHALFHLGRPNILPVGDLGVRRGMQVLYGLKELPTPAEMERVASQWEPYRSVGCYYMWRVEAPKAAAKKKKASP